MEEYQKFFLYGHEVRVKVEDKTKKTIMMFCQSNYSFLEFVSPKFQIYKNVFIYQIRSVKKLKGNVLKIRMRNYSDSFKIYCYRKLEQEKIFSYFQQLLKYIKTVPYTEYSIKNLIRYTLCQSDLDSFDNKYSIDSIEIKIEFEELNKLFRQSVKNLENVTKYDFRRVFKILLLKEELAEIYKTLINFTKFDKIKKTKLKFSKFVDWIKNKQDEEIDTEILIAYFQQIKSPNNFMVLKQDIIEIDFEEFCSFIFSNLNNAFDPKKLQFCQDIDQPINKYFVSASYNTYLLGHQNFGSPTIEGYERALENGCRFIEIDCWDGPFEEPMVTHAKTYSSDLPFKTLIEYLNEIAFKKTDMPLIINLDTHCSRSQRDFVAKTLLEIFGEKIYILSKSGFQRETLPTLNELKNKILIKCRSIYPHYVLQGSEKQKTVQEPLSSITTFYDEVYNEGGLRTIYGFSSLNEGKVKIINQNLMLLNSCIDFHQKYMNFIYPDLQRVDSTNYNPIIGWNLGIQATALNIQRNDRFTMLNKCKFMENGNCGYVLKPEYLMKKELRTGLQDEEDTKITFAKIKIISTQIIMREFENADYIFPYVEVKVEGMEIDKLSNMDLNTKIYQNNLFHSIYQEKKTQPFEIKIRYPELAFIIFTVKNAQTNKLLKYNAIPFNCLRKGLRSIELYDSSNNHDSFSFLLANIEIQIIYYINQVNYVFAFLIKHSKLRLIFL